MKKLRKYAKINGENMETWLSGRKRLTANEVRFKNLPGFESLRLRKVIYSINAFQSEAKRSTPLSVKSC